MMGTTDSEGDEEYSGDEEPEYHPEADDAGVFWCPKCGSEMYGDSTRCPKCGDYVTPGARRSGSSMPRWMWAALILAGLGFLAGLIASLR